MSIHKSSIEASLHGRIDSELKYLKLCGRRFHSVHSIHTTELQILQRFYYKNKNQHRGALFWRNVIEIRRFMERIEALDLNASFNAFRSIFYETTQNVNSFKGPWTHFPESKYLSNYSESCDKASKLLKKAAERCVHAYRSFYRSMQSAAFLQILLVLVAISSRLHAITLELYDILAQVGSCASRLSVIISTGHENAHGSSHISSESDYPQRQGVERDMISPSVTSVGNPHISMERESPQTNISSILQFQSQISTSILIERTVPKTVRKESISSHPIKKKRKDLKNEIDNIFGF